MNKTLITFFTVLFCLTSSFGWSLEYNELVKRDGLYYKKFTEVPFTGEINSKITYPIEGKEKGKLIKGIKEGYWVKYYGNGQLWEKGNYKNGKENGTWVMHHFPNGEFWNKGEYKNGKREGFWVQYYANGQLDYKVNYKNGKQEGSYIQYWNSGELREKGNYKNGKKEGYWINKHANTGLIWKKYTGTFKNGKKISD